MKQLRNIIEINEELCNGCGQCILDCAEGAITLVGGKAKVVADLLCDGLGSCIGACPTGALSIIQRKADAYDEDAVQKRLVHLNHVESRPHHTSSAASTMNQAKHVPMKSIQVSRCKGSAPVLFTAPAANARADASGLAHSARPADISGCSASTSSHRTPQATSLPMAPLNTPGAVDPAAGLASTTSKGSGVTTDHGAAGAGHDASLANLHWPAKLRLMQPDAPFLKGAHLLIAAVCATAAAAQYHAALKKGKVALIVCPKFEDKDAIHEKLALVCQHAQPASITVARMEVPCCQGIGHICHDVANAAGIPLHSVVITRQGEFSIV